MGNKKLLFLPHNLLQSLLIYQKNIHLKTLYFSFRHAIFMKIKSSPNLFNQMLVLLTIYEF